jgi:hypothetical protein
MRAPAGAAAPGATRLAPATRAALTAEPATVPRTSLLIWRSVVNETESDLCPFNAVDAAVDAGPTSSGTGDETEERALPDELDFS